MIKIILEFLPYLFLGIVGNILIGTYNSVFTFKDKFSWKKLFEGIWKSFVIASAFIISSIIYDKLFGVVELGSIEIEPSILLQSAIVMYLGKIILGLKDILKVVEVIEIPAEDIEVIER